jgi:hypothetical protein
MTDTDQTVPGAVVTRLAGRGPLNLLGRESIVALKAELDRLHGDPRPRSLLKKSRKSLVVKGMVQ